MKILVIDDEKHVRRLVGDTLRREGFQVVEAKNGFEGVESVIADKGIDLILLDVRMPKMDGFMTIREIRQVCDTPVIFLTANDDVSQEVKGLRLGAYDYITKPFSYEVLIARVTSCLSQLNKLQAEVVEVGQMIINMTNREIAIKGTDICVTQKEFDVIELLIRHKNMSMERNRILDKVWGYDYYGDQRTVDTHIKTLRAKMGDYGKMIKTVRGVGYYIELD